MITIFCDFCQISAKKLAFFSKTNVMITIFAKTSFVLSQKRQSFPEFFGEKKNHNIGPWLGDFSPLGDCSLWTVF
jgi:hypothetical protein